MKNNGGFVSACVPLSRNKHGKKTQKIEKIEKNQKTCK